MAVPPTTKLSNYDGVGTTAPVASAYVSVDGETLIPASAGFPLPVVQTGAVGKGSAATLTSTDTGAYLANDAIGPTNATAAALTFANFCAAAGEHVITSAQLEIDITAVPSGMTSFRLHLYSVTPPSALNGNAPFDLPSGDRAAYLGFIELGTPADLGATLYVEANGINKQVTAAGTSVFGYLVTSGAYTPANPTVFKVTLHTVPV